MKKISVLLVDDHPVVREGLRALLAAEEDVEVIAEAENGRKAVKLANELRPDVVIMDVAMPLLNGMEATRQIVRSLPATRVLVLSTYGQDDYIRQVARAGASGYLVKHTAASDLLKAIREVYAGNAFFGPAVAQSLREQCREAAERGPAPANNPITLTSREAEVLQLIAEGFANKQVASELGISVKTVEKHRQQVMNKLKIHDIAGLTRYAVRNGFVEQIVQPAL
jgi:DNA-binding NarL/FixJ family response regulator